MANEKRLIWDEDAKRHIIALAVGYHTDALPVDRVVNAILHHTPTVDAVEVVHGRWIELPSMAPEYKCSKCGQSYEWWEVSEAHYCPNCGAKMDGGNEDG